MTTAREEQTQQEADALIALAHALIRCADGCKKDAAALRAYARAGFDNNRLPPGTIGLMPGAGYDYARMRLRGLHEHEKGWPDTPPMTRGELARFPRTTPAEQYRAHQAAHHEMQEDPDTKGDDT
jgi:hypothetical protein